MCECVWTQITCIQQIIMHIDCTNQEISHLLLLWQSTFPLFRERLKKKKKKKLKSEKNLKVFFLLLLAEVGNVILKFINFLHRGDFAKTQEGRKTVWHMCYSLQRPQINYWEKKLKPSDNGSPEVELQPWVAASAFPGQNFSLFVCCSGMGT